MFANLTENDDGYFLGSIICINTATDKINAPKFEVVDGQQRLNTISLFFATLYTTMNSYKDILYKNQQSNILQPKCKLVLKKTQSDIRVIPQVKVFNRGDFMCLLAKIDLICCCLNMITITSVGKYRKERFNKEDALSQYSRLYVYFKDLMPMLRNS